LVQVGLFLEEVHSAPGDRHPLEARYVSISTPELAKELISIDTYPENGVHAPQVRGEAGVVRV
jgi:hypothetical protein